MEEFNKKIDNVHVYQYDNGAGVTIQLNSKDRKQGETASLDPPTSKPR